MVTRGREESECLVTDQSVECLVVSDKVSLLVCLVVSTLCVTDHVSCDFSCIFVLLHHVTSLASCDFYNCTFVLCVLLSCIM